MELQASVVRYGLASGAILTASVGLVIQGEVGWLRIGTLILVAAAVPLILRTSRTEGEVERASGLGGARLLLAGTAMTACCAAFLYPLTSPEPAPVYADATPFPKDSVEIWHDAVTKVTQPSCLRDYGSQCQTWKLDERPYPQAAGSMTDAHGVPGPAPLRLSADGHWIAYLERVSRQIVHRDLRTNNLLYLTRPLADVDVPELEISGRGRFVALSTTSTVLYDTSYGDSVILPAIRRILDQSGDRIAGTSGSELIVFDRKGKPLFRTPMDLEDSEARFYPDRRKILIIRSDRTQVDTYDLRTGKHLYSVYAQLPDLRPIEAVTGWKDGRPVVTRQAGAGERTTFTLDPATGRTTHVRGSG